MQQEAAIREPLILGNKNYKDITDDVVGPIQGKAPMGWKIMITITSIIAFYGVGSILYLIGTGIGVWGSQDGSGYGVHGSTPDGSGVYGSSTSGT